MAEYQVLLPRSTLVQEEICAQKENSPNRMTFTELDICYLVSFLHTQPNPPGGFSAWWKVIKKLLDCKAFLRFKACWLVEIWSLRADRGGNISSGAILKVLIRMNSSLRTTLLVWKSRQGFLIGRRLPASQHFRGANVMVIIKLALPTSSEEPNSRNLQSTEDQRLVFWIS